MQSSLFEILRDEFLNAAFLAILLEWAERHAHQHFIIYVFGIKWNYKLLKRESLQP